MKRFTILLVLVLAFSMLLSACGADKNVLVVGTSADYPPYESKDTATNEFIGFDMDLIREIGSGSAWKSRSETWLLTR